MKPEAQQLAIAEARGWKPRNHCRGFYKEGHHEIIYDLPDYLNDANAMRDARKVLTPLQKSTYARILTELTWQSEQPLYCAMDATAAQQAEAFLRTIGKWESPTV